MITITNQYNSAIVYSDRLDPGAEGLLSALCGSPVSEGSKIRIMPDVHPGKGCAVGTTMTVTDKVAPGLVGVDIGCGMEVFRVFGKRLELQKLDKLVHEKIPSGRKIRSAPHRFAEQVDLEDLRCVHHVQQEKARCSIGTLGGGNHFIEVDRGVDDAWWLVVHSGSRHLGLEVASWYQGEAFRQCPEGTPYELAWTSGELLEDYLHDMRIVQRFAALNRQAMVDEIVKGMKLHAEDQFTTIHNYIDTGEMVLRKGAVSARAGERLLIPINMRDGSLICTGLGNEDWNCSAPHGAGRLMSRAEAKQSFTVSAFKKEMDGVYTTSVGAATLDECPMAYKPMEAIVDNIAPTAQIERIIRPVYNFKAGDGD